MAAAASAGPTWSPSCVVTITASASLGSARASRHDAYTRSGRSPCRSANAARRAGSDSATATTSPCSAWSARWLAYVLPREPAPRTRNVGWAIGLRSTDMPRLAEHRRREAGHGQVGDAPRDEATAPVVEETLMDEEALRSAHSAYEVDGLTHRGPRPVRGDSHDVHPLRHVGEAVAGMEEGWLAGRRDHDADVADPRDVAMDDRVEAADRSDRHAAELDRCVCRQRASAGKGDLLHDLRLHVHAGLRVCHQQRRYVLGVEVVGVLVRDDDGVEVDQAVPA